MARSVFISYRREDSGGYTGRLHDRLVDRWGADRVFLDIDNIPPGEDFVDAIDKTLDECILVLIVIGPRWLEVRGKDGNRRIDSDADFHRLEIQRALQRMVRIMPVLVGGARMPQQAELPSSLFALARRNAFELTDRRFNYDCTKLAESVDVVLADAARYEAERQVAEDKRRREALRHQAEEKIRQETNEAKRKETEWREGQERKSREAVRQLADREVRQEAARQTAEKTRRQRVNERQDAEESRRQEAVGQQAEAERQQETVQQKVDAAPTVPPVQSGLFMHIFVVALSIVTAAFLGSVGFVTLGSYISFIFSAAFLCYMAYSEEYAGPQDARIRKSLYCIALVFALFGLAMMLYMANLPT